MRSAIPAGGPERIHGSAISMASDRKVLASESARRASRPSIGHRRRTMPFAAVALGWQDRKSRISRRKTNTPAFLKSLNAKFSRSRPSRIADISEDGGTILVGAASDRDPGTYALFDTTTNNLRPLYQVKPWLKPEQLGERKPFWFKASSGMELDGFITLPPHRVAKNLPTLLLPHGGPLGIEHQWTIPRRMGRCRSAVPGQSRLRSRTGELSRLGRTREDVSKIPASGKWAPA